MKILLISGLPIMLCLLFTAACETESHMRNDGGTKRITAPGASEPEKKDLETERKEMEHKLSRARMTLEKLKLEQAQQRDRNERAVKAAESELGLKKMRVDDFISEEAPMKIRESLNELNELKNALKSAEEELDQLEMMYKEDDLGDKTKEIVLDRSRRALALKRDELELKEKKHAFLEGHEILLETKELQVAREAAIDNLEAARRQGEIDEMDMRIRIDEAQEEVDGLVSELGKPKKEKAN